MNMDKHIFLFFISALAVATGTLLAALLQQLPGIVLWISSVSWNLAAQ